MSVCLCLFIIVFLLSPSYMNCNSIVPSHLSTHATRFNDVLDSMKESLFRAHANLFRKYNQPRLNNVFSLLFCSCVVFVFLSFRCIVRLNEKSDFDHVNVITTTTTSAYIFTSYPLYCWRISAYIHPVWEILNRRTVQCALKMLAFKKVIATVDDVCTSVLVADLCRMTSCTQHFA